MSVLRQLGKAWLKISLGFGYVAYVYNPCTYEAETGGLP